MYLYVGLDGSTSGLDREKLINLFNADDNDKVHLFLLSTRYGDCGAYNLSQFETKPGLFM